VLEGETEILEVVAPFDHKYVPPVWLTFAVRVVETTPQAIVEPETETVTGGAMVTVTGAKEVPQALVLLM